MKKKSFGETLLFDLLSPFVFLLRLYYFCAPIAAFGTMLFQNRNFGQYLLLWFIVSGVGAYLLVKLYDYHR